MPRSSRKNSHRTAKRGSRDEWEPEFSSLATSSEVRDRIDLDNGGSSADVEKNWRYRFEEPSLWEDRWDCGEKDEKAIPFENKYENLGHGEFKNVLRSKISVVDVKERSGRKAEGVEREEEYGQERSKYVIYEFGRSEENRAVTKKSEMPECQKQDELLNTKLEKEYYLHKRRECYEDKYKWQDDSKETGDRQLHFEDVCTENGTSKGGRSRYGSHNDGRYRGKCPDDLYTSHRHQDDGNIQKHSSRELTTDRSYSKNYSDEYKYSEGRHRKSKLLKSNNGGSYTVECSSRQRYENNGRKSSYKENNEDLEAEDGKEPHGQVEKYKSDANEYDSHTNRTRTEYLRADRVDSKWDGNRQTSFPRSSILINRENRHNTKQEEPTQREFPCEERFQSGGTSMGDFASVSGQCESACNSQSMEKIKAKDDAIEADSSKYSRTTRSEDPSSPFSDRSSMKHSLDLEGLAQRDNVGEDGRSYSNESRKQQDILRDNPAVDHFSQSDREDSEHILVDQSTNGNSYFSRSSSEHLPPLPVSAGVDIPSNLGPYKDDIRIQRNYKFSSRFRRNADHGNARGQGNAFMGMPVCPSPLLPNRFIPFQNGLLHSGHNSTIKQYPAPSPFCITPPLDMNRTVVPYHMHEVVEHFPGYAHPFGWHDPVENPYPPELAGWGTSKRVLADDSHTYGRPKQDHNGHVMGNQMRSDMWKGQKGNTNCEVDQHLDSEYSARTPADESSFWQSLHRIHRERHSEQREMKRSSEALPTMIDADAPLGTSYDQSSEPPTTTKDESSCFCSSYFSKLDISNDLASPDLYKKCMTILGSDPPDVCDVIKDGYLQNAKAETEVLRKSSNCMLSSLFPARTETTFQKAMSLYKMHKEFMKLKCPALPVSSSGGRNSSEASDKEELEEHDDPSPKENGLLASANSSNTGEDECDINVDVEGDHPRYDQKEERVCSNSGVERCQNSNTEWIYSQCC